MERIYEILKGKIAEQKKIRRITDADLARMTGISVSSIRAFQCGARDSEKTAKAIAKALEIEI